MPRNRSDIARDEKLAEIVGAARRRVGDGGYAGLSVADVARELGLAQNAIYWYFPTKDHLFVAAVERVLHEVIERKPKRGTPTEHVLWFADQLAESHDLRLALRERARSSDVVATFEADVVALLRAMLLGLLGDVVPPARLGDTVDAVMALCEGLLLQDLPRTRRRRLLRFGLDRLLGASPGDDA